ARGRDLRALRARSEGLSNQSRSGERDGVAQVRKLDPDFRTARLSVVARSSRKGPAVEASRPALRRRGTQPFQLVRPARNLSCLDAQICRSVSEVSGKLSVLIVGGYGTFGGRLVELIENDSRLTLIVAGRSRARADAFVKTRGAAKAQLVAAAFDRDGDVDGQLAKLRPEILVDASGPFQAYGEGQYKIVEACIAKGIHYLDLADGSDFVAGVSAFDAAARAAGIF